MKSHISTATVIYDGNFSCIFYTLFKCFSEFAAAGFWIYQFTCLVIWKQCFVLSRHSLYCGMFSFVIVFISFWILSFVTDIVLNGSVGNSKSKMLVPITKTAPHTYFSPHLNKSSKSTFNLRALFSLYVSNMYSTWFSSSTLYPSKTKESPSFVRECVSINISFCSLKFLVSICFDLRTSSPLV